MCERQASIVQRKSFDSRRDGDYRGNWNPAQQPGESITSRELSPFDLLVII
jgi:hypothetical protein